MKEDDWYTYLSATGHNDDKPNLWTDDDDVTLYYTQDDGTTEVIAQYDYENQEVTLYGMLAELFNLLTGKE